MSRNEQKKVQDYDNKFSLFRSQLLFDKIIIITFTLSIQKLSAIALIQLFELFTEFINASLSRFHWGSVISNIQSYSSRISMDHFENFNRFNVIFHSFQLARETKRDSFSFHISPFCEFIRKYSQKNIRSKVKQDKRKFSVIFNVFEDSQFRCFENQKIEMSLYIFFGSPFCCGLQRRQKREIETMKKTH